MKVCVIGTGYVGLVTGACLAHIGHQVICIDNNETKVALIQSGQSPIYEPGLTEMMQAAMQTGNLQFTTDLRVGVEHGQVLFIAVGTPPLPTGESNTRYYAANAFLATKISFINEIANICDRVGADVTQVAQGIGRPAAGYPVFMMRSLHQTVTV